MNKTALTAIIVVVVLVGGGLLYWYSTMGPSGSSPANTAVNPTPTPTTPNPTSTTQPVPAPTALVAITNFAFSPATLTVKKGTTVIWTNNDSAPHTVTGDNGGPSGSAISQGGTYSYTFNTVGSFPYHCSIHPSMKATVQVTD
jgi:plastocyanin